MSRKIIVRVPVKKLAQAKFTALVDDLYNRLQQTEEGAEAATVMRIAECVGEKPNKGAYEFATRISTRADCQTSTLQLNKAHPTFRVTMTYTNYDVEPDYGYLRPVTMQVSCDDIYWRAVLGCYLRLCKQVGKFI
jgi:hypothetical protein